MKKKILIIRSVSFQQLDKNLVPLEDRFPESQYQIHLLTHSHGLQLARSYASISRIIDYGSRKNFTPLHLPQDLKKNRRNHQGLENTEQYEALIVPVTNQSGAGFLNVMMMAWRIPAKSIYICNLTSEIWKISRKKIAFHAVTSCLYSFLATILGLSLAVVTIPAILIYLTRKRDTGNV